MARDWVSSDLLDPTVLINQSRKVSESAEPFYKAKGELDSANRMSKVVYSSIRKRIKEASKEKMTQDDLKAEVECDPDWAQWLKNFYSIEMQYIKAQIEYEKEYLKWKSIQSAMSLMKVEMSVTKAGA